MDGDAALEQEELLEDQARLRRRPERGEQVHRRAGRRKVRFDQSRSSIGEAVPLAQRRREEILDLVGHAAEQIARHRTLHPARHRPRLLVDGDDTLGGRMTRLAGAITLVHHFHVGIDQLEHIPKAGHLAVQDDALVSPQGVLAESLVRPDGEQATRVVAHERFEDLEPAAPGPSQPAIEQFAGHGRPFPFLHGGHGLERRAILVAVRQSRKEVAHGSQARVREGALALRPDALERAKGDLEEGRVGHGPIASRGPRPGARRSAGCAMARDRGRRGSRRQDATRSSSSSSPVLGRPSWAPARRRRSPSRG
jgi:hypothetical protein